jgi:hypothetical protein
VKRGRGYPNLAALGEAQNDERRHPGAAVGGGDVFLSFWSYLMCTPEIAREITSRWISAVPSKMS